MNERFGLENFIPLKETKKVGIIGSGMMGHGITYVTALSGTVTVIIDRSEEALNKAYKKIESLLEEGCKKGKISEEKRTRILSKIKYGTNPSILKDCDLVIEAVFEDRAVKASVNEAAESYIEEAGVIGSNTSTLPLTSLAKVTKRPGNFIGLHFFSPVHKMKLDEINLNLSKKVMIQTERDFKEEGKEFVGYQGGDVLNHMVEKLKRTGKAEGAGFYEYPDNGKKYLWPKLREYFPGSGKNLEI